MSSSFQHRAIASLPLDSPDFVFVASLQGPLRPLWFCLAAPGFYNNR